MPDSAVLPCLHGCPISSKGIPCSTLLPHILLGHLPAVKSHPCPGFSLQSLCPSFQPLCVLGDLHPCLQYVGLQYRLSMCGSHSIQTITDQLLHFLVLSNASPLSQTIALMWGILPPLQFLHSPEAGPVHTFSYSFSLPSFILLSFA